MGLVSVCSIDVAINAVVFMLQHIICCIFVASYCASWFERIHRWAFILPPPTQSDVENKDCTQMSSFESLSTINLSWVSAKYIFLMKKTNGFHQKYTDA